MPLHPHPHDLPSAPPAISEISFLRSQLSRTAREHTLRLALLSNSYSSRISQLSQQHDAQIRMYDAKLVLLVKRECEGVKREYEGKAREVEALQCELESLRCRYDATVDIMRREADERVRGLDEKVRTSEEKKERLEKEKEEMEVELGEVRKERDEGIEGAKVKDAEAEELREKLKTLSAENAALTARFETRATKVKNLPTAPRAMIMASTSASASNSSFISSMASSSFSRSAVPCPPATSMVDMPTVRLHLSGGPLTNRPDVEKEDTTTMIMTSSSSSSNTSSSSSSSSFLSQSQSSTSNCSIATSTSVPSSSASVSPIAVQCTGAPRRVPGVFFPPTGMGLFGHAVKSGPSQSNMVVASSSFTPHSDVCAMSAFPASTSSSTSLSPNAHLNNTALSEPRLQQTKSQTTKPRASAIVRSDKPSAFATLTNNLNSRVSTSAFASTSTSNPLPASGSASKFPSRMAKRAHSSAFMDDYEYEYIAPAPGSSLIDRIEPRTTLSTRKRPHLNGLPVTGVQVKTKAASNDTVPVWSRAGLKAADSEGLKLDRMNLEDCDERDAEVDVNGDRDIVKVKTEQNDVVLLSDSPASSQVKERSKDETRPTVKTESPCATRTRLRSGAFGTFTYSRRRL